MPSRNIVLALGACLALAVSCESFTEVLGPTRYTGTLNGASVKPTAVATAATGKFTGAMHPTNGKFSFTVTWSGLSGAVVGAEFRGPADAGGIAGILVDLAAPPTGSTGSITVSEPTGSATGELDLTLAITPTVSGDSLKKLLIIGRVYVTVRTAGNLDGEIRGQIGPD